MMGLFRELAGQLIFEVTGTLAESVLRIPILGDMLSMTGDTNQMLNEGYPVYVDGFSAPARYELKRQGIRVLAYNNNGIIWVSHEDGPAADAVLERY